GIAGMGGIGGVGGIGQPGVAGGPGVSSVTLDGGVRVMADRINNALLVHATPAEYEHIEKTLLRLDVQRAQVLIEASIVEITLGDDLKYGLQWAFRGGLGDGRSGRGVVSSVDGGALGGALAGFSYSISNAAGNLTAVLNALAAKSKLKVISSPSLMVLDNHTASIAVGDQQPVNTGTVVTGNSVVVGNNIQYKDTGVMLSVTPSVNAGDLVTLDIQQAITDVGATIDDATGQRPFLQRQINSRVAVRSGETLVLGGLIKESATSGRSGVPVLSSIPVLGALFGSHNESANRTELLVVFTPRVLRDDDDARAISRELRDRMRGLTAESLPGAPAR
ncbi:type II secretion system protein GspD, partial [Ottowia beijingensis]|uniref:type II secretion system protein GspD n=2 Tax=Ottowia TaxID=219181 RepID=UPI003A521BFF